MDHKNTALLMPWYVNDTLPKEESIQVAHHIQSCSDCALEYQATKEMWQLLGDDKNIYPFPKKSLDKMLHQIDACEKKNESPMVLGAMKDEIKEKIFSARPISIVALLFILVASAGSFYFYQSVEPEYVVLTNSERGEIQSIQVKILFDEAITELAVHDLLNEVNGAIVKSILEDRSYIVSIPVERGDFESLLASLTMLTNHDYIEYVELEGSNENDR